MNTLKTGAGVAGPNPGLPDIHVGVISSNTGPGELDLPQPHCPFGGDSGQFQSASARDLRRPRLSRTRPTTFSSASMNQTITNYTGDIADALGCIAGLGDQGCDFEGQLKSVRWALDPINTPSGNRASCGPMRCSRSFFSPTRTIARSRTIRCYSIPVRRSHSCTVRSSLSVATNSDTCATSEGRSRLHRRAARCPTSPAACRTTPHRKAHQSRRRDHVPQSLEVPDQTTSSSRRSPAHPLPTASCPTPTATRASCIPVSIVDGVRQSCGPDPAVGRGVR